MDSKIFAELLEFMIYELHVVLTDELPRYAILANNSFPYELLDLLSGNGG